MAATATTLYENEAKKIQICQECQTGSKWIIQKVHTPKMVEKMLKKKNLHYKTALIFRDKKTKWKTFT